ncbi:MAG: glycoside hydrolase family 125 protein [Candidatus Eremiobacteraeota bacterium]|nr:glycoside hydrolase family 125 protein [Candidatus Eremiobacteraeota bacterium]
MTFVRILVLAVAVSLLGGSLTRAGAAETQPLSTKLDKIYLTAFDEALNRHASLQRDGTTYVSTGDIEAEWLRDASAVMEPYIGQAAGDDRLADSLRGVVAREAKYILIDPYANAFSADYKVVERKFEVDSLLYPIWFADKYWSATGDRRIFTPEVNRAFERVLATLRAEQHHDRRSAYRHPDLVNGGKGSWVRYTGMIWTGFRPSDDPARYQYNIPDNMFAAVVLRRLAAIEGQVYHNPRDASNAWGLAQQVQTGIEQYGKLSLSPFGKIYAYEVDGYGHANVMDDANIPSLLSIPYFGYLSASDPVYQNTRRFALSDRNPYYYQGKYASGIGSPHTPHGYIWPLSLIVQALTAKDPAEVQRVMGYIAASDVGDHRLHESFNSDWPEAFTRDDFAWPNALYGELVTQRRRSSP